MIQQVTARPACCIRDTVCTSTHGPICFSLPCQRSYASTTGSELFSTFLSGWLSSHGDAAERTLFIQNVSISHLAHDEIHAVSIVHTCTFITPGAHRCSCVLLQEVSDTVRQ